MLCIQVQAGAHNDDGISPVLEDGKVDDLEADDASLHDPGSWDSNGEVQQVPLEVVQAAAW